MIGPLKRGDVEPDQLSEGMGDPQGAGGLGGGQHRFERRRHELPAHAEAIDQPAAGLRPPTPFE